MAADERQWKTGRRELLGAVGLGLAVQACGGEAGDDLVASAGARLAVPPERVPESGAFPTGVASGDVAEDSAVLWTQHTGALELELVVYAMRGPEYAAEVVAARVPRTAAGFVHATVRGLEAGARYRYVFFEVEGSVRRGRSAVGRFRCALAPGALEPVTFGATACTANGRSMAALSRAAEAGLDLHLLLGDTTYNDDARTLGEYRARWSSQLRTPGYLALRASTSLLATWDDHEVTNDWNPETLDPGRVAIARDTYFESLPLGRIAGAPDRLWRKASWGGTADFFVLDGRSERLPSTRRRDEAQYLSRAQMDWLKAELTASRAVFKVIVNSVPVGDFPGLFDFIQRDRWEGYPAARDELLRHVEGTGIPGVLFVSGDFHLGSVGRVSRRGLGSATYEVLAGPGDQSPNPIAGTLGGEQFEWVTSRSNYTSFSLDPASRAVLVRHVDGGGRTLNEQVLTVG